MSVGKKEIDRLTRGLARLLSHLECFRNRSQGDTFVEIITDKLSLSKKYELKTLENIFRQKFEEYMEHMLKQQTN